MSTHDAAGLGIARYVQAVQTSDNSESRVQSAAFWNSLGLDRRSERHVALVRTSFEQHGIAVSTSIDELGHEPPDAWIVLTSTVTSSNRIASISELPESLFGASPAPEQLSNELAGGDDDPSRGASVALDAPEAAASPPFFASPTSGPALGRTEATANVSKACPSCGTAVPASASFCMSCGRPSAHADAQSEPQLSVFERARIEGWLPAPNEPKRTGMPVGTMIVIGVVALSVGALLGGVLMPFLAVAAFVFIGATWLKPSLRTVFTDRGQTGRGASGVSPSVAQIVSVVAVVASIVSVSVGTRVFSGDDWELVQDAILSPTPEGSDRTRSIAVFATQTRIAQLETARPSTPQPTLTPPSGTPTATPEATEEPVPLIVTSTVEQ